MAKTDARYRFAVGTEFIHNIQRYRGYASFKALSPQVRSALERANQRHQHGTNACEEAEAMATEYPEELQIGTGTLY